MRYHWILNALDLSSRNTFLEVMNFQTNLHKKTGKMERLLVTYSEFLETSKEILGQEILEEYNRVVMMAAFWVLLNVG